MLIENLKNYRIILASHSPRRQHLLHELGLEFDVVIKEYPETYPEDLTGEEIARHVAYGKAIRFRNEISDNEIVITADTIVWCNNKVLGKPVDFEDAVRILREISGNTHEVITGVCLLSSDKEKIFSESTKVTFEALSTEEINFYVDKYKPYDKAGAYGIQEWIGIAACSNIEGSYFNVVGLPVQRLYRELQNFVQ
ncbi:MAG: Maf family nucleotide pyrophosphatase [Bacteroidales bacterium]|nr:Maf family nucleotide pyrophosphatase [Bacteroidales bacterium]